MVPTSSARLGTILCMEFNIGIWMALLATSLRSCGFSAPLVRDRVSLAAVVVWLVGVPSIIVPMVCG